MGRAYLEFEGFDKAIARLTKLDGNVKATTEKALKETHKYITGLAEEGIQSSNLPAKGKYSKGDTEKALVKQANIEWAGTIGSVPVGFSIKQGGLASIFLIWGTPRVPKVQKLYNALSGKNKKTTDEAKRIQEEIFYEEIRKLDG